MTWDRKWGYRLLDDAPEVRIGYERAFLDAVHLRVENFIAGILLPHQKKTPDDPYIRCHGADGRDRVHPADAGQPGVNQAGRQATGRGRNAVGSSPPGRGRASSCCCPRYRYPSDTNDLEWALLERLLPTPACQTPKGGAPEKWPRHRLVDSVRYIVDNGRNGVRCPRLRYPMAHRVRLLRPLAKAGVLKRILDQLRRRLRPRGSRCPWPVRVITDAQSVKGAETVSKATRGWDQGKVINGRERQLIVDQDGLLVDLLVTPADVQERAAARILLTRFHAEHPEIVLVWADNAYGGEECTTWAQDTLGITIKVVPRPKDADGFVVLPKR